MNQSLLNKNALVCGGSQGIGEAIARGLSELGAHVTLLSRDAEKMKKICETLPNPSDLIAVDLSDIQELTAKIQAKCNEKTFHIVINNAGGPKSGPLLEAGIEDFEKAFQTHVLASHTIAKLTTPGMKLANYGRIINIISTSVKAPIVNLGVSNTIRGAMASWAKTLAGELGVFNITVNNVLPGFTKTERLESLKKATADRLGKSVQEIEEMWLSTIPMNRLAESHEVASAVCFLASPAASYINGINVPVDGGRTQSL